MSATASSSLTNIPGGGGGGGGGATLLRPLIFFLPRTPVNPTGFGIPIDISTGSGGGW